MQKTLLIGYLGKDPEMKYTPGGTAIATFTIASTERWKNSAGETQEHTVVQHQGPRQTWRGRYRTFAQRQPHFAYRNRFHPAVHKRLMRFATLWLLDAGFDRWPVFGPYSFPVVNLICFTPLLLLVIGYDWWSTGKVQHVTIWSTIFLVIVQQVRHPLGHTAAWQSFAASVATHVPASS